MSVKYNDIIKLISVRTCFFLEAEEEVLCVNHAEIGGVITKVWNFPWMPIAVQQRISSFCVETADYNDDR